ncbi:hypothetical protein IWZ01DRAFT_563958 [Phyllosticta capitalensis]
MLLLLLWLGRCAFLLLPACNLTTPQRHGCSPPSAFRQTIAPAVTCLSKHSITTTRESLVMNTPPGVEGSQTRTSAPMNTPDPAVKAMPANQFYQQGAQYIRALDEGRGNQRRRGIWIGDTPVESPETLSSVLEVDNGPLMLILGIESLLQRNKLLEMQLRNKERELAELKANHSVSGISARQEEFAPAHTTLSTGLSTSGPTQSTFKESPRLSDHQSYLDKPFPSASSLSSPSSAPSQQQNPGPVVHMLLPNELPAAGSQHLEAQSQPQLLPKQDEPGLHSQSQSNSLSTNQVFDSSSPKSTYKNSAPEVIDKPIHEPHARPQHESQSTGVPSRGFTFHLPIRPSPLREELNMEREVEEAVHQDNPAGPDIARHNLLRDMETALGEAADIELAHHDRSQSHESKESFTELQELPAFPDPELFSGNPDTFHTFDSQVLLKFAVDRASFPTPADRYTYLMSRLEGDVLELLHTTAGTWLNDRESLNPKDDEEPWMVAMTILSMAYGRESSPAEELESDSGDWSTCEDSSGDEADCPSGKSKSVDVKRAPKLDDECRPKPEVFTSKPYVLTEEEAWAAAEKMAKRQAEQNNQ